MKCPKCKKQLRNNARFCPACGAVLKKKRKIKSILLVIIILLSITSIGYGGGVVIARLLGGEKNNAIKGLDDSSIAVIQEDLEVFSDGDISEITERVFGAASDNTSSGDSDNGIIAILFTNADVQVSSIEKDTITYTIVSPDISDFFQVKLAELQTITTTEELRQAIINYAKTAPQKEYTVTLPYTISDESGIDVAYNDPDFINAMTGGLIDAYADLYNQYLEGEW